MKASFSRQHRLRSQREFKQVLTSAKKLRGQCISLFYSPNQLSYARLGISVSRNNVRQATARNRLKRIIRSSFRLNQQRLAGYDIVAIGYKGLDQLSNPELQ